ncbi:MAG: hypothetical protein ABFC96_06710, partial [Thermoguttaceae bacterium]
MSTDPNQPEKKIIIDEDWKSQVQAEKEAARQAEAGEKPAGEKPAAQPSPGPGASLPPPDLTFLIGTLYLQGAM